MPFPLLLLPIALLSAQQAASAVVNQPQSGAQDDQLAWVECPSRPELRGHSETKHWFEGTLGIRPIRIYLAHVADKAVGSFYAADDWRPVSIGGRWSAKGKLALDVVSDSDGKASATGRLVGQVSEKDFFGTWRQTASGPDVPVRLHEAPEPMCDGNGPWLRFSDERWPIEFSYPSAWHLEVTKDELRITCPNPRWMAYADVNISLSTVTLEELPLRECSGNWTFNDEGCESPERSDSTTKAVVRTRSEITYFTGWENEHRLYCREGGYVGQSEGEYQALRVGATWLQVSAGVGTLSVLHRIEATMKQRP